MRQHGSQLEIAGLDRLVESLTESSVALMLYGSRARGDHGPESDIDVLRIVRSGPLSARQGAFSIVGYSRGQLSDMVGTRSLFAWHLVVEGITLWDPEGVLHDALAAHPGPDTERVLERVRRLSAILDVADEQAARMPSKFWQVGQYLLRTAVYARAIGNGGRSFSIARAAESAGAPEAATLIARLRAKDIVAGDLGRLRGFIRSLAGELDRNPYGSLEALAVRSTVTDSLLSSLAVQALLDDADELDYTSFPATVL